MSDEIDIEEHDVMDNPSIRRIFPDLSVIKKEINQYYDEGLDILPETTFKELSQGTEINLLNNHPAIPTHLQTETQIGTNEFSAGFKVPEVTETPKDLSHSYDNIIILGSKPSEENRNKYCDTIKKQEPKLILNNISSFLKRSNRYCKDCFILFPKANIFNLHMYNVHTQKRNDSKTLMRSKLSQKLYKTVHGIAKVVNTTDKSDNTRKSHEDPKTKLATGHACFHCQQLFSTQSSLIEHLYDVLNPKTIRTGEMAPSSTSSNKRNKDDNLIEQIECEKNSDDSRSFECSKCELLFTSQEKIDKHNLENHFNNKTELDKIKDNILKQINVTKRKSSSSSDELTENDEKSICQQEMKKVKEKKDPIIRDGCTSDSIKLEVNECNLCTAQFNSKGKLKYHILTVHKKHTKFTKENKVKTKMKKDNFKDIKKSKQPGKQFYRCLVCSKYNATFKFYSRHVISDHNMTEVPEVQKVLFDSKCKFCSSRTSDISSYNVHLYKYHKRQLKKKNFAVATQGDNKNRKSSTKKSNFAFKSVLYNCTKCDLFFLSANVAMCHSQHSEISNNWKCPICQRKFKNIDKELHMNQHSFCQTFAVYTLSESAFRRVLYKCSQCAVHYREDNFLLHYKKCGSETPNSLYCKVCDILINKDDMDFHELNHKDKKIQCFDFTVIESDIIDNSGTSKVKKLKDVRNINNKNGTGDSSRYKSKFAMSYCHTCKSFVSNNMTRKIHFEAKCGHMLTTVCKGCGLVLTMKIHATHKELHKKMQLNLQHYVFYDLNSKKRICPPIPDYPSCNICGVHFLRKNAIQTHSCQQQEYKTCSICYIKLTEHAYKLHMPFHYYSIQNRNIESKHTEHVSGPDNDISEQNSYILDNSHFEDSQKTNKVEIEKSVAIMNDRNEASDSSQDKIKLEMAFCHTCKSFVSYYLTHKVHIESKCGHMMTTVCQECGLVLTKKTHATHKELHKKMQLNLHHYLFYDLKSKKQICPPVPDYLSCSMCEIHFLRKSAIKGHSCLQQEYMTCNVCSIKLTEHAYKLHMPFHNYSIQNVNTESKHTEQELEPANNITEQNSDNLDVNLLHDVMFMYTCKSCQITVNTYDKVVQHCQDHYDYKVIQLNTKKCQCCNFIFYIKHYEHHNKLHLNGKYNKSSITVVDFDPFYFRFSCDFWTKHIFAYVADEQIRNILNTSLYKYECRLKMEELQSGSSGLTLYKCNKCRVCIEPHLLYMHAENSRDRSCVKLRKHPCAFCGLCFVSPNYRIAHEKEHQDTGTDLKSYKIVLFNKTEDETFNKIMYDSCNRYILYQCRNCDSVVDKFQRKTHQCDVNNLKKCLSCGLLLHKLDYDLHFIRHEELDKFNSESMIVVMFGKLSYLQKKELRSTFSGTIYDYTIYKCKNCELCFKSNKYTSGHVCVFDHSKCKCSKCGLYFSKLEMKSHSTLHESDLGFDEINMNLITFDSTNLCVDPQETIEEKNDTTKQIADANEKSRMSKENTNICSEKLERIYKCDCGLHFLEELNAQQHANNCNVKMKISKQSCFKCDLLFTPGELFNHLLKHHCDKKLQYKFDIVIVYKRDKKH